MLCLAPIASESIAQKKKTIPVQKTNGQPEIKSLTLDGKTAGSQIKVNPQEKYVVVFQLSDPEGDALNSRWELLAEEQEAKPQPIPDSVSPISKERIMLNVPISPGNYRLWLYVNDGNGNTVKNSIPFTVLPN